MRKTKQEVEAFLQQFLPKFSIWGIVFLDREKNKKAIEELDLAPIAREPIVKSITTDDYIDTLKTLLVGVRCGFLEKIFKMLSCT